MSPIAVHQVLALFPGMIRAWRELQFEHGVYKDDEGRLHKGLQVIAGSHPQPGVRYLVAIEGTEPPTLTAAQRDELKKMAPAPRASREERRAALDERSLRQRQMFESNAVRKVVKRYQVEIREDSRERLVFVILDEATASTIELSLDQPATPRRLSVRAGGRATGRWPLKGRWTVDAELDLDKLPPHSELTPQLRGRFRHRNFRGDGYIGVHARSQWIVYLTGRVGGRGLMRPAVALATLLFGSRVRDDLRRRLEEAPDFTGQLQGQLDELHLQVTADADAARRADEEGIAALGMLLEGVVEEPDAPRAER